MNEELTQAAPQSDTEILVAKGFELVEPAQTEATSLPLVRELMIRMPTRHNTKLQRIIDRVNQDDELYMYWRCANINAVERLGMSDHGPVHVQIVANIGLKLLRLLMAQGITPSIVAHHNLSADDAEIVVVLGALLHDIGMSIHRDDHERFSLILASEKLRELLAGIYDVATRTVIMSEVLHAIIAHRSDGRPLTLEAGVVRIADALDMAKGRSRIAFEAGKVNIHSLSAAAIDHIEIQQGEHKPVRIAIDMLNSAGVFQVDELLKEKLSGSGLEPYMEIVASIQGDTEKKLVEVFRV